MNECEICGESFPDQHMHDELVFGFETCSPCFEEVWEQQEEQRLDRLAEEAWFACPEYDEPNPYHGTYSED